jgi:hypothetical protein
MHFAGQVIKRFNSISSVSQSPVDDNVGEAMREYSPSERRHVSACTRDLVRPDRDGAGSRDLHQRQFEISISRFRVRGLEV